MIWDLIWILALVVFGGLLGGYLSGPLTPGGHRIGLREAEDRGAPRLGTATKLSRFRVAVRPIMAGVGGAIVAVAFVSGLVEHQYQEITWGATDSPRFVGGVLKLLAVAILGGYLGVRLIDQIAERLLAQEIKQVKDELGREINVERALRQSAVSVRQGFPGQALQILDDLLNDVPRSSIRPDDLANLRVLRGYALKRLGRLDEAQLEIEDSLSIKPTYAGWYNKACYTARANPTTTDASKEAVKQALVEAYRLAQLQGGRNALMESLRRDTEENGDLHAFKDTEFISELLSSGDHPAQH